MFRRSLREETIQMGLDESTRTIYFRAITPYITTSTLTALDCFDFDCMCMVVCYCSYGSDMAT